MDNTCKNLVTFSFLLFCLGCEQTKKNQNNTVTISKSKYETLLNKYKQASFDTLKIESIDYRKTMFNGIQLDSAEIDGLYNKATEEYFRNYGVFACLKFDIDSATIGLITRTPSEYESTSIKLFIFDKEKDSIVNCIELSEDLGDGGYVKEKKSWLIKSKEQKFNSFTWLKETQDNSVENINDSTIIEHNYYCLLNISRTKIDTLTKDNNTLSKAFHHLIVNKEH